MTMRSKLQRGFSLVSAIFLLVVIAALGAFAVTLSTTQHQGAALDVMGARAYQAAKVGVEWGMFQVITGNACFAPQNLPALAGTTMDGFAINVTCAATPIQEVSVQSGVVTVYNLTSRATQGNIGTANYVEREIAVTIAR